jgi:hypothetical protein
MLEGQQATYSIRVINTLNETVDFTIEPVRGMEFIEIEGAQPRYELAPNAKRELKFLIIAPMGSAGKYEPVFIVNETKPDNPSAFVDTSISPQVSFGIRILAREQNASQNSAVPPDQQAVSPPAAAQPAEFSSLFAALFIALALVAGAGLHALMNRGKEGRKAAAAPRNTAARTARKPARRRRKAAGRGKRKQRPKG